MRRRPGLGLVFVLVGAALGLFFASVSTRDFASHLDREVHSLSCSFVPGLEAATTGASGCKTTMLSEYSSVLRGTVWGGLPISLPAMGVFAFLLFFAVELWLSGREHDRRATALLFLATLLPALTSAVMATISLGTLDAVCKICLGIYAGSALGLVGGVLAWRRAGHADAAADDAPVLLTQRKADEPRHEPAFVAGVSPVARAAMDPATIPSSSRPSSNGYLLGAFGLGVVLVAVPSVAYLATAPDHAPYIGTCGGLGAPADEYGVFVPFDPHPGGVRSVELLDPLCPACRAFEKRLETTGMDRELDREAVLFPLDSTCNWMVEGARHPGACAISEAVLCAGERAGDVLAWSFAEQKAITAAAKADPAAAERMAEARFPDLAACIGSAASKARLNKSLRWAVKNQLQVLTPQLFVEDVRLCPEDVDLGLDFALSRMIEQSRAGTLPKPAAAEAAPTITHEPAPGASPSAPRKPASSASPSAPRKPASDDDNVWAPDAAPAAAPAAPSAPTEAPPATPEPTVAPAAPAAPADGGQP